MRKLIVLPLLIATAFGGTSAKSAKSAKGAIVPPPVATPSPWFAGATAGYLLENECEYVSGHVGKDLKRKLWGWDTAAYLEVAYFGCDMSTGGGEKFCKDEKYCDKKYYGGNGDDYYGTTSPIKYDLDVIPVTLNYKLERRITNTLSAYMGIGAGVAFMDLEANPGDSDDDIVFFAQAFAGLLYNVTEQFEIFTGARVIYFDDPSFNLGGVDTSLDDAGFESDNVDGLFEVGARYNF